MSLTSDLKTASRSLRRSPGFAIFATLALAAGIGLTLYMFGAINAFVLRPLPFKDADRLVHVELADPTQDESSIEVPYPDFLAWRGATQTASDFAAYYEGTLNLADQGDPERLEGVFATGELFDVLGARAEVGRAPSASDSGPGAPPVVVLSRLVFERRYGSDPSILGRPVRVNGRPATIVGVMPESFRFPQRTEAWTTIPESAAKASWRDAMSVEVLGHVAPGSSQQALAAELDAVLAHRLAEDITRPPGWKSMVKPFAEEYVGRETRKELGLMFLAVVLVLLIACANVANLLYARGVGRQRDLAVRAALGASRRRLVAFGLAEALAVSLVAAALGLALAQAGGDWTMESLRANEDMSIPSWVRFEVDGRSLAATFAVAILAALGAGLAPALSGSRPDVQKELRATSRGAGGKSRRGLRALVVTQIALCCALVTVAGLAARSISKLADVSLGVDATKILGGRVALFEERFPDEREVLAFYQRAEEQIRQIPGVVAATVASSLPGTFVGGSRIEIEGRDAGQARSGAEMASVAPSYFDGLGVSLLSGRTFAATDVADSEPVAIVSREFARRYFQDVDALGHRFRLASPAESQSEPKPWLRIVGVSPDLQQDDIDSDISPTFYRPLAQDIPRFAFLAVRTTGDAGALKTPLQKAVTAMDPDMPVYFLRTLEEWSAIVRWSNRFLAGLYVVFAFAGLVLAAIGVYGTSAYAVAQRTSEIGVRRALGAKDAAVVKLVSGRSARDLAWGLGIGLVLAAALAQPVAGMFFGVEPFDPPTFALVPLVLAAAVALATFVPVRRALGIEPAVALREE